MGTNFLNKSLEESNIEIAKLIKKELSRQQNNIELIASENIVSKAVMEAQGSILTNKYAEGYPNKRYYGGCYVVDEIEVIAQELLQKLFECKYSNVQPHSGSQANMSVYLALLNPKDTILGMDLNAGGHLTHGSKVSSSGKLYNSVTYNVDKETNLIDYEQLELLAIEHKPKIIIAGGSSYSRLIDFSKFRLIADKVGAYLMVDMAHFAGLVAGKQIPSPIPFADVVTSTTHKTLRGPRGGIILSNNQDIMKKINSAVFPGIQGGPLMHVIASKAISFKEALTDDFKNYAQQIIKNAQAMSNFFMQNNVHVVTGGTDTHLFSLNVTDVNPLLTGDIAEKALEEINITCNKNSIPYDSLPPSKTSGIRIGTPAITTRGLKEKESMLVASYIYESLLNIDPNTNQIKSDVKNKLKTQVLDLMSKYPIYNN